MNIPIGIFFGGATPTRDQSLQSAQQVYEQLKTGNLDPLPIFVDPFGQLILLEKGMPDRASISDFYPSEKYFSAAERSQFMVYPEQLGTLGAGETLAMGKELGRVLSYEDLAEHISVAFLCLPDVSNIQERLTEQKIPFTGESADLIDLSSDRYSLRLHLQQLGFEMPAALRLTAAEWEKSSLQAIWGEDSASVAYPLLLRPIHQQSPGRSSVVTSKDGPNGLRRGIDLAFGQKRLPADDWLDMSPVDRENFVRHLAHWSSGVGFPLVLDSGEETIVFQRPKSLLDYLKQTAGEKPAATFFFRSQRSAAEILVESLPEGTALSCLLIRKPDDGWEASSFRFLGAARNLVAGTEAFPAANGPVLRVSESLSQQVLAECRNLAEQLPAQAGIRIYGLMSPAGDFIPEEVQPFTGPKKGETLAGETLKSFIVASLRARQAEKPEPVYRSIVETLTASSIPGIPSYTQSEAVADVEVYQPPPASEPEVPVQITDQTIYDRELEKLNKEKEVMPESIAHYQESTSETPEPKRKSGFWPSIKSFFTSRVFLRNLAAMALFVVLLFLFLNMGLRIYTKHGDSMQLEDYQGLLLDDARRKARAKGLKMEIISQSFQPGKRANEIFAQYPAPLSNVKENRTVFVSVYQDKGKEIVLPAFTEAGDDIDNYRRELGKRKIRVLVKDQKFDGKLAEGTILYLLVNGEKITNTQLRQGKVKVMQGGEVEAVISTRTSNVEYVPNLICQTLGAAQFAVTGLGFTVGRVYGGAGGNRDDYYVWKQEPDYQSGKLLNKGTPINIYVTATQPDGCD